jgi:plastocyanin
MLRRLVVSMTVALLLAGCGAPLRETNLELTVKDGVYLQPSLTAPAGSSVSIRFQNRDMEAHSLTIELPSGDRTVSTEKLVDAILVFPAQEPGEYRYYCRVPGHTESGVLTITP